MKTAVVLYSLGGPANQDDVFPFLNEMFRDPVILPFPKPIRYGLAWLISSLRKEKAKKIYDLLGGGSPLLKNTEDQAQALQKKLEKKGTFKCFVIMRYAEPRAKNVIKEIINYVPDLIIHLPLYPQFSGVTSGSSLEEFKKEAKNLSFTCKQEKILSFQTDSFFCDPIIEKILEEHKKASAYGKPLIILSAHGLPEKTILSGDPYQTQCEETAKKIQEMLGINYETILAYQSRVGWQKWIKPFTDKTIEETAKKGRPIIIAPIAFVSEHSETIVELGIEYRKLAKEKGSPFFSVVPTVGTDNLFINGLAEKVLQICNKTEGKNAV